jgi:hypothetical protein
MSMDSGFNHPEDDDPDEIGIDEVICAGCCAIVHQSEVDGDGYGLECCSEPDPQEIDGDYDGD